MTVTDNTIDTDHAIVNIVSHNTWDSGTATLQTSIFSSHWPDIISLFKMLHELEGGK